MAISGLGRYPFRSAWGINGSQLLYNRVEFGNTDPTRAVVFSDFFFGAVASGSYTLTAQGGSYSGVGSSSLIAKSKILSGTGGVYNISGTTASIYRSKYLTSVSGSYSFSGASAGITFTGLSANYLLTAQGGIYSLAGSSADITYTALSPAYLLVAQGGTYTASGNSIDLRKSKRLTASGGVYSYIGQQVNITAGPVVVSTLVKYINVLTGEILLLQPF